MNPTLRERLDAARISCLSESCSAWHAPEKVVRGKLVHTLRCGACFEALLDSTSTTIAARRAKAMHDAAESAAVRPTGGIATTDTTAVSGDAESRFQRGLSVPLDSLGGAA